MTDPVSIPQRGPLAFAFAGLQRLLSLCMLALVALCALLVFTRYTAGYSPIAATEATQWLHALVLMLGAPLALRYGGHVRVDVLHARWSARTQALIELLGALVFLLPFAAFLLWISLDYVSASMQLREASQESGGLPALYLLKALIPLTALLLLIQGVASISTSLQRLRRG